MFMDDLLREFFTETNKSLDTVDNQLVRFEQDPNNAKILDNIFRLVHTSRERAAFSACRASRPWRMPPGAIETEARFCSRPQPTVTVCRRRTNGGPLPAGRHPLVD
jgi:hypothetical protein